jgi:hypothetical protein
MISEEVNGDEEKKNPADNPIFADKLQQFDSVFG